MMNVHNPVAQTSLVQSEHVLQLIWTNALAQVAQGYTSALLIPGALKSLVSQEGVEELKSRYSKLIGYPVIALEDTTIDAIVIKPDISVLAAGLEKMTTSNKGKAAAKVAKVPRPPNSFILYRQHHHPIIKAQHPDYHNNRISTMLGEQWSRESAEVKARWKAVADDIKKKHSEMFPDYQYQPRKPSEKKRRMTRRKAAALSKIAGIQDHNAAVQSHEIPTGSNSSDLIVASASNSSTIDTETGNSTDSLNGNSGFDASTLLVGFTNFPEPLPTFETAPNGNRYFDLDNTVTDEAFVAMLDEYNESMPHPDPPQAGAILPNDYPVVHYGPSEDSINDLRFFSSMCDWDGMGNEAQDNINDALPLFEPEPQFDWENDWSFLTNAELERMPAGSTCPEAGTF